MAPIAVDKAKGEAVALHDSWHALFFAGFTAAAEGSRGVGLGVGEPTDSPWAGTVHVGA